MNYREAILATFSREKTDIIVWQPRIEHWYNVNKARGSLPEKYRNKELLEIYDDLDASVRYFSSAVLEPQDYLKFEYKNGVEVKEEKFENSVNVVYKTPIGNLHAVKQLAEWNCSWHYAEYLIKNMDDLKIFEYVLENRIAKFDYDYYQYAEGKIGKRGISQFYFERSPLQSLIIQYMGYENTIYALQDYPKKMEHFLNFFGEAQDQMYETLVKCPVKILNLPENIDSFINPPTMFEKYHIPYYKKRVKQIHKAGKFCHIHMDGSLKTLLPFIKETECDGVEGATTLPQGDVTLEELKEAMEDMIFVDGIPAILLLKSYSYEELEEFTLNILKLFHPNIIFGISDEIPPDGDIEKVRFVSQIVKKYKKQ